MGQAMTGGDMDDSEVEQCRRRILSERDKLAAALSKPHEWQAQVLRQLIDENGDTEFGRQHGFARLRSIDDYREAVPIRDYAAFEPWIARAAAGERNVLTVEDPVLFFMSSGTTGDSKMIPVTPSFMRQTFFPFYFALWAGLIDHVPEALMRDDATYNLKFDPRKQYRVTPSGLPHLGISQVDFEGVFGERLIEPGTRAPWRALPVELADDDHVNRAYVRLCLAAQCDLRCIVGFNPALVAALPCQLALWWPRILKDIHDGTLCGQPTMAPNPGRASTLERLATYFGTLLPSHVWPNMRAICCWNTGISSLYMPRVAESFGPNVRVLPAPIAASEGPVALTLDRHATAGSPVVGAALHEFLDADEEIRADSETMNLSDLEIGREYHVVLSHVGGLYRYALGDVVRVVDRIGEVPRLEYAGRRTVSDSTGERLRESHIIRALKAALLATGQEVNNVTCHVEHDHQEKPRYGIAVAPRQPFRPSETNVLAAVFDRVLQDLACGYRDSRRNSRLGKPVFHITPPDAFFREWQARIASGTRPPQAKDRMFTHDGAFWRRLTGQADANDRVAEMT
jgi:GH3 auxin-responsive promoter